MKIHDIIKEFTISDLKRMGVNPTRKQLHHLRKINHENGGNITRSDLKKVGIFEAPTFYDDRIQRLARAKDKENLQRNRYNLDPINVDLTPKDLDFDYIQPEEISGRETTLDKFKRWNKMLRGKEPIYTTKGGTEITVDPFGDTTGISFNKPF